MVKTERLKTITDLHQLGQSLVEQSQEYRNARVFDLFTRYKRRMLGYTRSITGNQQDAEDIVSRAFVSLLRPRANLYPRDLNNDEGFMMGVIKHQASWYIRDENPARHAQEVVNYRMYSDKIFDNREPNDNLDLVSEDVLGRSFAHTPQTLLALKLHLDGFRYIEIATMLGIPIGTVKSRIFNARMKVRNMLE